MWIRAEGAFEPVVDAKTFYTAQGIIAERNRRYSDQEMLERLRRLFERHGYLSGIVIDEGEAMPSSGAYRQRFGSLLRAYSLVGFTSDRDYRYVEINRMLRSVIENIARRQKRPLELLAHIGTLRERGYNDAVIAEKTGLPPAVSG